MIDKPKIVEKPWGHEIWFAHSDKYAGKILFLKKGFSYSLQYHEVKEETQYVYRGKLRAWIGKDVGALQECIINQGESFNVLPGVIHKVEALEDTEIFEVSSPELDDIIRLKDEYGRTVGKGNTHDQDKQLHEKLQN
ncbi:MAG: cupin [Patescibacteria group bacterium]